MEFNDFIDLDLSTEITGLFNDEVKDQRVDFMTLQRQSLGKFDIEYTLPNVDSFKGEQVLVIPEMHIKDTNLPARKDYVAEMKDVFKTVKGIIQHYLPKKTIVMGEIFDRGFKTVDGSCYWFHEILDTNRYTELCCVKGNHEDSFYKNNPIWYLGNGAGMNGLGTIKFPPNFLLNDVAFNFHHHGMPHTMLEGKTNVSFMHTDVMTQQIREVIKHKTGEEFFWTQNLEGTVTADLFTQYDIVFNGHMHKVCAMLEIKRNNVSPLTLVYTSTLGRTNITEVDDNSLWKYLYLLDVYDGKVDIHPIGIRLPSFDESVILQERINNELKAQRAKERKLMKKEAPRRENILNEIPFENGMLKEFYIYASKQSPLTLLDSLDYLYKKGVSK